MTHTVLVLIMKFRLDFGLESIFRLIITHNVDQKKQAKTVDDLANSSKMTDNKSIYNQIIIHVHIERLRIWKTAQISGILNFQRFFKNKNIAKPWTSLQNPIQLLKIPISE